MLRIFSFSEMFKIVTSFVPIGNVLVLIILITFVIGGAQPCRGKTHYEVLVAGKQLCNRRITLLESLSFLFVECGKLPNLVLDKS